MCGPIRTDFWYTLLLLPSRMTQPDFFHPPVFSHILCIEEKTSLLTNVVFLKCIIIIIYFPIISTKLVFLIIFFQLNFLLWNEHYSLEEVLSYHCVVNLSISVCVVNRVSVVSVDFSLFSHSCEFLSVGVCSVICHLLERWIIINLRTTPFCSDPHTWTHSLHSVTAPAELQLSP